jgi:poly-gamma-glutamate capsule biosynthesis protein CapA/YwtB (metallophosphatase superfamily)
MMTNDVLNISISGDFCPGYMESGKPGRSGNEFSPDMAALISTQDYNIINLECPLTESNIQLVKTGPCLKASPEWAGLLSRAGINAVTLANNHIMDYSNQGLADTLKVLDKKKISHVGADLSPDSLTQPLLITKGNITAAVVNFSEHEYACSDGKQGGANPINLIDNSNLIHSLAAAGERVIVIIHGSNEYIEIPSPDFRKLARFYADSGAAIVIAHHSHMIGGYEYYKGVPIYYSLGNFFFPAAKSRQESWYKGMTLLLTFNRDEFQCTHRITSFAGGRINLLSPASDQEAEVTKQVSAISSIIRDDDLFNHWWDSYFQKNLNSIIGNLLVQNKIMKKLVKSDILRLEKTVMEKNFLGLYHLLNCESHREMVQAALELYRNKVYRSR